MVHDKDLEEKFTIDGWSDIENVQSLTVEKLNEVIDIVNELVKRNIGL